MSGCTCNDVVPWCSCRGAAGVIGEPSRVDRQTTLVDLGRPERGPGALCHWCQEREIPVKGPTGNATRSDALTCSTTCRQKRARFNRGARSATPPREPRPEPSRPDPERPMRFAYADPPYPGFAHLYADHPDYGGEVDHGELIDRLIAEYPDGWALSTSSKTLAYVLQLCTERGIGASSGERPFQSAVRIGAWTRPMPPRRSYKPFTGWEPVLIHGGRSTLTVGLLDWHHAAQPRDYPQRVIGIKPSSFSAWVFDSLGARDGDQLDDLFPGSGAVGRAWDAYVSQVDGRRVAPRGPSRRGSTRGRAGRRVEVPKTGAEIAAQLAGATVASSRVAPAGSAVASLGDERDASSGSPTSVQQTVSRPFKGRGLDATPASPLSPPSPKKASREGTTEPENPHA